MGAAAELRKQIESALAGRIPAALSPRPLRSPELVSCGVAEVDVLLGGGLPLGAIVELTPPVGAGSSGRTTLALSTLSGLTRRGHCCAYVDACDTLDPLSAAALGVELRRLLWVRSPAPASLPHLPKEGRYGAPSSARLANGAPSSPPPLRLRWENRIERALRATDLLLNAGGWGAVVLDLGELAPAQARRVPLATWYRFRLQAEKSRALLLLLTPIACANSCAAVSLHSEETQAEWRLAAEILPASQQGLPGTALLAELHHRVSLSRNRSVDAVPKKPPASHPASPPRQAKDEQMRGAEQTWWTSTLQPQHGNKRRAGDTVWPG